MHKFDVKFIDDCYFIHQGQIAYLEFIRSVITLTFKNVRAHAPIRCIKLGIPIYFIDHSEFITVQCKKILSKANNETKCFEFSSIKRALRPPFRTIIAI